MVKAPPTRLQATEKMLFPSEQKKYELFVSVLACSAEESLRETNVYVLITELEV